MHYCQTFGKYYAINNLNGWSLAKIPFCHLVPPLLHSLSVSQSISCLLIWASINAFFSSLTVEWRPSISFQLVGWGEIEAPACPCLDLRGFSLRKTSFNSLRLLPLGTPVSLGRCNVTRIPTGRLISQTLAQTATHTLLHGSGFN